MILVILGIGRGHLRLQKCSVGSLDVNEMDLNKNSGLPQHKCNHLSKVLEGNGPILGVFLVIFRLQ